VLIRGQPLPSSIPRFPANPHVMQSSSVKIRFQSAGTALFLLQPNNPTPQKPKTITQPPRHHLTHQSVPIRVNPWAKFFLFKPRRGDLSVARGATPGKATQNLHNRPVGAAYRPRQVQRVESAPETPIREKEISRHRAGNQEDEETNTQPSSLTTHALQSVKIRSQSAGTALPLPHKQIGG